MNKKNLFHSSHPSSQRGRRRRRGRKESRFSLSLSPALFFLVSSLLRPSLRPCSHNETMGEDLRQLARRRVLVRKKRGGANKGGKSCFPHRWIFDATDVSVSLWTFCLCPRRPLPLPASPAPSFSHSQGTGTLFFLYKCTIKITKSGGHPRLRQALALPVVGVGVAECCRRCRKLGGRRRGRRGRRLILRSAVLRPGPRRGDDADRLGRDERLRGARLWRGA